LVKDICKLERFDDTLQQARLITSFVKDRNSLSKRFERIQNSEEDLLEKRGLEFVDETRWYTHHSCVRRVLDNKIILQQLVNTNLFNGIKETQMIKPKKDLFRSLINNDNFWSRLKEVEETLRPTSELIGILESNSSVRYLYCLQNPS
jgi:hypothetical protein